MRKIAVTGAAGFIGYHVLRALEKQPVDVIAITRDKQHLNHLGLNQMNSNYSIIEMDIGKLPEKIFERLGQPDVLIHLAWDGLPNYHCLHHFEMELPKHYQFIKQLVEQGLTSAVITGTCFEYGMQSGALAATTPALPTNSYGYAKHALRQQLTFLQRTHPFTLTWARLFYLFGERQSPHALYQQLRSAVERGDEVFNLSGGAQLRDYLPVTEVANSLVSLALARSQSQLVNICSGQPISIRNLVEDWMKTEGWKIKLNFGHYPYPDFEPLAFWGVP